MKIGQVIKLRNYNNFLIHLVYNIVNISIYVFSHIIYTRWFALIDADFQVITSNVCMYLEPLAKTQTYE